MSCPILRSPIPLTLLSLASLPGVHFPSIDILESLIEVDVLGFHGHVARSFVKSDGEWCGGGLG